MNCELLWVGGDAAVGVVEHYGSGYFLDHLFQFADELGCAVCTSFDAAKF